MSMCSCAAVHDGPDLVISRDYISQGFRGRAGGMGHIGIGVTERAGNPGRAGERGRGGTVDQSRPIAPRHLG
jgi:hypothetical protein